MKRIKIFLAVIIFSLCLGFGNFVFANQMACNPIDTKPQKLETRLATFAVAPDMVAVGQNMIAKVTSPGGLSNIVIDIPTGLFEVVDYSPKIVNGGTAKAGLWSGDLIAGDYTLTLKAKHYTVGKWVKIGYSATGGQGTGYGDDYFFTYYDTMSISIDLSQRNEAPQTTMDVVRKITITAVPDVKLEINTDRGMLGPDIGTQSGRILNTKANSSGQAVVYLFAKEKDKVNLTASSPDSCQDSTNPQKFSVVRSDIGRNVKTNYSWSWWLILIFLIIIAVAIFIIKRNKNKKII